MIIVPESIISTFQSITENRSVTGSSPVVRQIPAVIKATYGLLPPKRTMHTYIAINKVIIKPFIFPLSSGRDRLQASEKQRDFCGMPNTYAKVSLLSCAGRLYQRDDDQHPAVSASATPSYEII